MTTVSKDNRLTHCPETGGSLDGISCAKRAANLWPSLDPNRLPETQAGRRYQSLLDEHVLRKQDAEDAGARSRAGATKRSNQHED